MTLPKKIDPIKFARQEVHLEGEVSLKDCERLQAIVDQEDGVAIVDLQFGKNDSGKYVITGCCDAKVSLICQRCGKPVEKQVVADVSLCPIVSESQAKSLPAEYDPLVTGGESVSLVELVEDELLLALPMAPMHPKGECPVALPDYLT